MKCSSIVFCASVAVSILVLTPRMSYAQAAWRCDGEDCQDALISDIEDLTVAGWPASQTIAMAGLPYTCQTKSDQCTHCATGGQPAALGEMTEQVRSTATPLGTSPVSGTVPWAVVLSSPLRSFLIGRFTASADLFGTIQASPDNSVWQGTGASYVFQDACDVNGQNCTFVTASGGSTGVVDLGPLSVNPPNMSGTFWGASLTFHFTVPTADIVTSCTIGYGNTVTINPGGKNVTVSYPVAWTPVSNTIAEAVRNRFRQAVRIAVTGSP